MAARDGPPLRRLSCFRAVPCASEGRQGAAECALAAHFHQPRWRHRPRRSLFAHFGSCHERRTAECALRAHSHSRSRPVATEDRGDSNADPQRPTRSADPQRPTRCRPTGRTSGPSPSTDPSPARFLHTLQSRPPRTLRRPRNLHPFPGAAKVAGSSTTNVSPTRSGKCKGVPGAAKGGSLDTLLRSSHNLPSLLIANRSERKCAHRVPRKGARLPIFNNQQPISVGVWANAPSLRTQRATVVPGSRFRPGFVRSGSRKIRRSHGKRTSIGKPMNVNSVLEQT